MDLYISEYDKKNGMTMQEPLKAELDNLNE